MSAPGNLLCVANFPTNTGYAWEFIEGLYAGLADDLHRFGVRTWVAYPRVDAAPTTLAHSVAEPIELRVDYASPRGLAALVRAVRAHNIRTIYLTDRATWHPGYAVLRGAGVRTIISHDHTSGARTRPTGLKRSIKAITRRFDPALADMVLAVSEYVARRKVEVDLVAPTRVRVLWNSVVIPETVDRAALRERFGIGGARPVIAGASRVAEYKGIQYLMEAFDRVWRGRDPKPVLVYFGDGPFMPELQNRMKRLASREDIILAGYRPEAADLLAGADVCVVPSTWQEAFGLAALEPSSRGVPVIGSRVGGIPEVIEHGVTGLLVEPADVDDLAGAIVELLDHPERRIEMGRAGRQLAQERFARPDQLDRLCALFRQEMGLGAA